MMMYKQKKKKPKTNKQKKISTNPRGIRWVGEREEVKKEGIQKGLCDYFKMSTNSFIFLTSKVEPNFPPMNNLNLMTHF